MKKPVSFVLLALGVLLATAPAALALDPPPTTRVPDVGSTGLMISAALAGLAGMGMWLRSKR